MTNNDLIRRLRYAFDLSNIDARKLFRLDPKNAILLSESAFLARLAKPEDDEFIAATDAELSAFLDGLIVLKRGLQQPVSQTSQQPRQQSERLTRNIVLKKLRIAMTYRDEDMLETLALGGMRLSKSELSAFFRKSGHKHYRKVGNQVMRAFLKGLTQQLRGH